MGKDFDFLATGSAVTVMRFILAYTRVEAAWKQIWLIILKCRSSSIVILLLTGTRVVFKATTEG